MLLNTDGRGHYIVRYVGDKQKKAVVEHGKQSKAWRSRTD